MTQPNYPPGMPPQMPPGMPPQGGYPQGGGYAPPPANQGNGMAVASLIFSILGFCLLFIGGLLGILFGIMGLSLPIRSVEVEEGSPLLALSLASSRSSLLPRLWAQADWLTSGSRRSSTSTSALSDAYIKDVSAGNVDAALDKTTGMTRTEVEAQVEQLKSLGADKSWSFRSSGKTTSNSSSSGTNSSFPGTAHFANGDKDFDVSITADSGGKPKISSMTFH